MGGSQTSGIMPPTSQGVLIPLPEVHRIAFSHTHRYESIDSGDY
jgi:hypothetical protein